MNWKLRLGDFLFKYRSFTPVPLIIIVFVFFKPQISPVNNVLLLAAGFFIMISGELIRVISVGFSFTGTSGRENFLRADSLNVSGIYSVVRNPLYIGNLLIYSGLLIVYSNLFALIFFDILLIVQYYFIILSEEEFLKNTYGDEYSEYKESVNSILPGFGRYRKPDN
ncbi:MAG: lipid A phosphate methyltransferase, partial [Candidatus Aminicenantes bacterium]|nr:lipid A phosphate methyltransferase [Candidatus Aminicenantes bacterium]